MQLEERVKNALQYEFAHESPLNFVQNFFNASFSPQQREYEHLKNWQLTTEQWIKNLLMLPLGTVFNPVYLAAAYLTYARKVMEEADPKLVGIFPEEIHGHDWYKFVDPNIDRNMLEFVSNCLCQEIAFLESLIDDNDEEEQPIESKEQKFNTGH